MPASENSAPPKSMDALRQKYFTRLREREAQILPLVAIAGARALTAEERAELQNQAHSLAGSGATYGYPAISEAGRALEQSIENGAAETAFMPLANDLLAICRDVLVQHPLPSR